MRLVDADALAMKLRHMGYMDENEEVQEVIDRFAEECDGDLISRQAAIDACIRVRELGAYDEIEEIKALPSIEKTEKWIPCSERLPEEKQVVLISNGKGHVRCGQYQGLAFRDSNPTQWWWKNTTIETVMAWMPLPEPYKGDKE